MKTILDNLITLLIHRYHVGLSDCTYLVILTVGTFVMVELVFNNTFHIKSGYTLLWAQVWYSDCDSESDATIWWYIILNLMRFYSFLFGIITILYNKGYQMAMGCPFEYYLLHFTLMICKSDSMLYWSAALVYEMDKVFRSRSCWPAQCDDLISSDVNGEEVSIQKGHPYAIYSPCYIIIVIYCQMEWVKPHQLWWLYTQDRFACDSESAVRISTEPTWVL